MVQPKYSPQEALEKMKLMMKYDSSKTLNENRQIISEQIDPTTLGYGATGALAGAGMAGGLYGATAGTAVFPVVGTAIGALVGLGIGALGNWWANKDYGKSGFEQVIGVCKAPGSAKLVPKMSKGDIRSIAYAIQDSRGTWNDYEDTIAAELAKIESIADLCSVNKQVPGGLFEFLDSLTDSPNEWKMFTRPLAGMIEDTEVQLTPEEQEKVKKDDGKEVVKKGGGSGYKSKYTPCTPGKYVKGCKSEVVRKVQACLKQAPKHQTGNFGPITQGNLQKLGKGFENGFTDADVATICQTETVEKLGDDVEIQALGQDKGVNDYAGELNTKTGIN